MSFVSCSHYHGEAEEEGGGGGGRGRIKAKFGKLFLKVVLERSGDGARGAGGGGPIKGARFVGQSNVRKCVIFDGRNRKRKPAGALCFPVR